MSDKRSNTRPYRDRDGKPITLFQLVRSDPDWAASTISHYENLRIAELGEISSLRSMIAELQGQIDRVGQSCIKIGCVIDMEHWTSTEIRSVVSMFDKDGKFIALEGGK